MPTTTWFVFASIPLVCLLSRGIVQGLFGGFVLALLSFSGLMQLASPAQNLLMIYIGWFFCMSILEMVGFFRALADKVGRHLMAVGCYMDGLLPILSYVLVWFTGDSQWVIGMLCNHQKMVRQHLLLSSVFSSHMALLFSPLSITGILLVSILHRYGSYTLLHCMCMVELFSLGLTGIVVIGLSLLPKGSWVSYHVVEFVSHDRIKSVQKFPKCDFRHVIALVMWCLVGMLCWFIAPCKQYTAVGGLIYPVNLELFIALLFFGFSTLILALFKAKPADIIHTTRYISGIQRFFLLWGLGWLMDSLILNHVAFFSDLCEQLVHGKYMLMWPIVAYLWPLDLVIVIWSFVPLLLQVGCSTWFLSGLLVILHSLQCISRIGLARRS